MIDGTAATRFASLTGPHLDAAYNLARWLIRNSHDAEDVVQEAYLRAFRFFDGFRGGDGRAWLLTIVRNTCYTWLEQNRHSASHVEYDDQFVSLQLEDGGGAESMHHLDPERLVLREGAQALVEEALKQLPLEYREILVLRELEELSYREISDIVGVPLGTVMSRLSRARTQLKRSLEVLERK